MLSLRNPFIFAFIFRDIPLISANKEGIKNQLTNHLK